MPSIYVASLSDYNAGHLHGRRIDLDGLDVNDVWAEIAEMLRESKHPNVTVECPDCDEGWDDRSGCGTCNGRGKVPSAEEWAIHDYDDMPSFGENPDLEDVIKYAEMVEEHGDAWRAYVEHVGTHYATEDDFSEHYAGEASSEREWVETWLEDSGLLSEIPENLRYYFDYDAYLRDMKLGGDVSFERIDGTVYAFWN
jgi:antirestriction protein